MPYTYAKYLETFGEEDASEFCFPNIVSNRGNRPSPEYKKCSFSPTASFSYYKIAVLTSMENNKTKNTWTNSVLSYTYTTPTLLTMSHLPMPLANIVQVSHLVWFKVKQGPSATDSRLTRCTLQISIIVSFLLGVGFFSS